MAQGKRELAVGLQLGEEGALVTYCKQGMRDPVTMGPGGDQERFVLEMPEKIWKMIVGQQGKREELSSYLRTCLESTMKEPDYPEMRIMITVPKLERSMWERIPGALTNLGIQRRNIFLQDYACSFYYYTVNQKRELWNGDVALLRFKDGDMIGHILHVDRTKTPALVSVEEAARVRVPDAISTGLDGEAQDKEKDRLLFELLKKVFERRNVVTTYLIGDYFDRSWAQRSFQYLCFRRHAFQGENLFTKGACYAAMERMGIPGNTSGMLFLGADIIRENLGMVVRVQGKETYYPLISAEINWYEAHHECELIPDGETSITILSKPMAQGQEVAHVLRMTDFPERPDRATRLRLTVYFVSPTCCILEAADLGFGGLYRSSGAVWKRKILL